MEINELSTYSQLIPFLIGSFCLIRNYLDPITKLFFLVIVVGTVTEIINTILWEFKIPNGIVMNSYTILSCLIFLFVFKKANTFSRKWILTAILLYCCGCGLIIYNNKDLLILDNDLMIFTNYVLMFAASITLIKMTNGDFDNLFTQPMFWISASLLIFSTASNISYSLFPGSNYDSNPKLYDQIWDVHGALNIFCNLLYSFVFICTIKNRFIQLL